MMSKSTAGVAMDQKMRNKIAWVLAIILAPITVYLFVTNASRIRKESRPRQTASNESSVPAVNMPTIPQNVPGPVSSPEESALDSKILKEQERISSLLPKRNPFGEKKHPKPPPNTEIKPVVINLGGIVFQKSVGKRMAIINGKMMMEGQQIEGWTITKITDDEVVLDNGKEQKTLRVGQK